MLSNQEIWIGFVKRVFATSSDLQSAARRLHKGHNLIFGEKATKDPQTLEQEDRAKRAIWAACLKCAENSDEYVDDVATRLIRVHDIIFKNNN